jgi:hypothetical protein
MSSTANFDKIVEIFHFLDFYSFEHGNRPGSIQVRQTRSCKRNNEKLFKKKAFFTFSRQIYVLGDHAMNRLAMSDVLLVGVGALGVEIGKMNRIEDICKATFFFNFKN